MKTKEVLLAFSLFLFTLFLIALLAPAASPQLEPEPIEPEKPSPDNTKDFYTPSTETHCTDGKCTLTLYSGTRYVYEDEKWVKFEEAKSVLKHLKKIYLKEDKVNYDFDVIEANFSYLRFNLSVSPTSVSKQVPITVCKLSADTCRQVSILFTKESFDLALSSTSYIAIDNILDYNFTLGIASTTIQLQDADSENLEDTFITNNVPDGNNGGSDSINLIESDGGARVWYGIIKFNISQVPVGQTIDGATLSLYLFDNRLDDDTEGYNVSSHHHYNLAWEETYPTWNNIDDLGPYNNTEEDDLRFDGVSPTGWYNWSANNSVSIAYSDSDVNVTFYMISHDEFGLPSIVDRIEFDSKESVTAAQRPYLNITYSEAAGGNVYSRNVSDTVACNESNTTTFYGERTVYDASTGADTDTRTCSAVRTQYDTATGSVQGARYGQTARSVHDSATAADAISSYRAIIRNVYDSATAAVTNSYIVYLVRSVYDSLNAAVTNSRSAVFARSVYISTISGDYLARFAISLRRAYDGAVSADYRSYYLLMVRRAYDSLNAAVTNSHTAGFLRPVYVSVTTGDYLQRAITALRSVYDAAATTDYVSLSRTVTRAVYDALTSAVSNSRVAAFIRYVFDSATIADYVSSVFSGAVQYSSYVYDSISSAVSDSRTVAVLRNVLDSVTSTDSNMKLLLAFRNVYDSATTAVTNSHVMRFVRSVHDAVTGGDFAARTIVVMRYAYDSATAAISYSRTASLFRTAYDALTVAVTNSRVVAFLRSVYDSINIADSVGYTFTGGVRFIYHVYETIGASVANSRAVVYARAIYDSLDVWAKVYQHVPLLFRGLLASRGYYYPTPYWMIPFAFIAVVAFAPTAQMKEVEI